MQDRKKSSLPSSLLFRYLLPLPLPLVCLMHYAPILKFFVQFIPQGMSELSTTTQQQMNIALIHPHCFRSFRYFQTFQFGSQPEYRKDLSWRNNRTMRRIIVWLRFANTTWRDKMFKVLRYFSSSLVAGL